MSGGVAFFDLSEIAGLIRGELFPGDSCARELVIGWIAQMIFCMLTGIRLLLAPVRVVVMPLSCAVVPGYGVDLPILSALASFSGCFCLFPSSGLGA